MVELCPVSNITPGSPKGRSQYDQFKQETEIEIEVLMKIKVVIHEAEEGGFWAEVPAIPGCATQGNTFEELLQNLYEAIEGCLSVDVAGLSS
ncbi:MAG: hypothetical protein Kow00121_19860 [Elainellaceae cyanobacterium]